MHIMTMHLILSGGFFCIKKRFLYAAETYEVTILHNTLNHKDIWSKHLVLEKTVKRALMM